MIFSDRAEAGRMLAHHLARYADDPEAIVLALPRGGVPVASEVATWLHLPLDVYPARKLGAPGHEEYAIGALAADGSYVLDRAAMSLLGVSPQELGRIIRREAHELHRREEAYRQGRHRPAVAGKTVIVVDDGLATGATAVAVVRALRRQGPKRIVVAVPVASSDAAAALATEADVVVAVEIPRDFVSVGSSYRDFSQVSDDEVRALLRRRPPEEDLFADRSSALHAAALR